MFETAFSWVGPAVLAVFAIAFAFVFAEEKLHLRKSKPVMVASGLIWVLIAIAFHAEGRSVEVAPLLFGVLLDYAQLLFFLLSAMSFVNSMVERNVFEALRSRLAAAKFSTRGIFWITGTAAFFISPFADNLTTALVMGTVVLTSFAHDKKAAAASLVNIVVAANAGGAFSPFGDITTLMIWQKGVVEFQQFFALFLPALANWLVPAAIISFALKNTPSNASNEIVEIRKGGMVVVGLFLATIAATVLLDHEFGLPPFLGMMMGFGVLNLYGYFLHDTEARLMAKASDGGSVWPLRKPFDISGILEKTEWDTLLYFYGIMLCVGGIGAIGYLGSLSEFLYADLGATAANIIIGVLSAFIDNIPLTFAVLTMNPSMDLGQWLLVTLVVGVGGSLLSIGSAAGVALMGIGRETYTFSSHLKWTWAIALGFAASIAVHFAIN